MSLRIGSGLWRSRMIAAPTDRAIRPTSDRARAALFNLLSHGIASRERPLPLPEGATVLDLFAGTGALGLEALSRGAARAAFIDNSSAALKTIRANIATLGAEERSEVIAGDAMRLGQAVRAFDLVLMDPPYRSNCAPAVLAGLARGGWLASGAIVVVEEAVEEGMAVPSSFRQLDQRSYGAAQFVILRYQGTA